MSLSKSLELMLLRHTLASQDVRNACHLAQQHHLATVCVHPVNVAVAAEELAGTDTRVCCAIGFPYGQETIPAKLVSVEQAQSDGADEMTVMLDHSAIAGGDVRAACHELERLVSSMFWGSLMNTKGRSQLTIAVETTLYDPERLRPLWSLLHDSPVGFVQTGSGHHARAVTGQNVEQLRQLLPADVAIKAVGGIHQLSDARLLINAGAVRIGSGSAVVIAQEERQGRQVQSWT